MCDIPRYNVDDNNFDVSSEDSSSRESPAEMQLRGQTQKPVHEDADDEVHVVSVTIATKKEQSDATM